MTFADEHSALILSHQELHGLKQILLDVKRHHQCQEFKPPAYVESLLLKIEHTKPLPQDDLLDGSDTNEPSSDPPQDCPLTST